MIHSKKFETSVRPIFEAHNNIIYNNRNQNQKQKQTRAMISSTIKWSVGLLAVVSTMLPTVSSFLSSSSSSSPSTPKTPDTRFACEIHNNNMHNIIQTTAASTTTLYAMSSTDNVAAYQQSADERARLEKIAENVNAALNNCSKDITRTCRWSRLCHW